MCKVIQPICFRAPEVILEAPWDTTTDLWNLGPVVFEIHLARQMFYGKVRQHDEYDPKLHLYEMERFFGLFPKEFLARGDQEIVKGFFNDQGEVEGFDDLRIEGKTALESEFWMEGLAEKDRELFASFLRAMMKIDPAERSSIKELLQHPWLHAEDLASQL